MFQSCQEQNTSVNNENLIQSNIILNENYHDYNKRTKLYENEMNQCFNIITSSNQEENKNPIDILIETMIKNFNNILNKDLNVFYNQNLIQFLYYNLHLNLNQILNNSNINLNFYFMEKYISDPNNKEYIEKYLKDLNDTMMIFNNKILFCNKEILYNNNQIILYKFIIEGIQREINKILNK